MPAAPDVAAVLAATDGQTQALTDAVWQLPPRGWDAPSNCPPWSIGDIVVHLVVGGESFARSVRRGLGGDVGPDDPDLRVARQTELRQGDPGAVVEALGDATRAFAALYDGLDRRALDARCFHRRGNRTVRWYATHRLIEVALHTWDFFVSAGREPVLGEGAARLALPTIVESNTPRNYAAGLSPERGAGERYALVVDGDPASRWLVTVGPEALVVARDDGPADLTLTGAASDLALLAYGRRDLGALERSGALAVTGQAAARARFGRVFPRP